ncbi:MAG TPA: zf-HC2 domain-containing protein [Thermosynechococcaceae cyanobacterium]
MNSELNAFNKHQSASTNPATPGAPNELQRDRFELLSAYLDGEVTAAERRQVENWLATDMGVQRLHNRLLKLRQGLQGLPVPAPERSVQQTVDQVFAQVERKPKLSLVWGGAAAIAALFVGALALVLPGQSPLPQVAQSPRSQPAAQQSSPSEPLLVALDEPLVTLPPKSSARPARSPAVVPSPNESSP